MSNKPKFIKLGDGAERLSAHVARRAVEALHDELPPHSAFIVVCLIDDPANEKEIDIGWVVDETIAPETACEALRMIASSHQQSKEN